MMQIIKRLIILFVLFDNFILNLPKKYIFKSRYVLVEKCNQCGNCCKKVILKMTPAQIKSKFFTNLAVRWITWLFDFILLEINRVDNYLAFTCKHLRADGKCGNYFWRPSVCRNYPLVDYFTEPKLLPGCGFRARPRV